MSRRTRLFLSSLLLLAVLVGVPVWLTWRVVRQDRLDRALITAVEERNADSVVSLLKQGANPNAREFSEVPVSFRQAFLNLFVLFRHRNTSSVEEEYTALLLAVTPWANEGFGNGNRPPDPYPDPYIVRALLDAGANPNCQDRLQGTPLHYAVTYCPSQVKYLLDKGAEVNAKDSLGDTALLKTTDPWLISQLLNAGADPNVQDINGTTALFLAIGAENIDSVRLLIDRGANVNARDKSGWTALMYAASDDRADIVRVLLQRHPNTAVKDSNGETAYRLARQGGCWKVVNLLKQAGAKE